MKEDWPPPPPPGEYENWCVALSVQVRISECANICAKACVPACFFLFIYFTEYPFSLALFSSNTRRYLISCNGSDWWLFLSLLLSLFSLLHSSQAVRTGGRWDLPALCWSCCTSPCPRVLRWSLREAQVFYTTFLPTSYTHAQPFFVAVFMHLCEQAPAFIDAKINGWRHWLM